ncbi:MAG: alpha/beta hydrolase fold domain-containing protein, partial [Hyphomicrobiales bacterium]|nr:alpha/beta hydrolase fold domain-containing protein [Hyphomicrobiales bacterium]
AKAGAAAAPPTLAERRAGYAALMRLARYDRTGPAGEPVDCAALSAPAALRLYRPADVAATRRAPAILFMGGGGFVAGDEASHEPVCRALAAESGAAVFSLLYRRAPEHPFPAAFDDAAITLDALPALAAERGFDAARLAVAGESVGATLALAALAASTTRPRALALVCPVLDLPGSRPSRVAMARGRLVEADMIARDLADFAPRAEDRDDPRLRPLTAALRAPPAAIVHVAAEDPFRDEGVEGAAALEAAGAATSLALHAGMLHGFHAYGALVPVARAFMARLGAEIAEALA